MKSSLNNIMLRKYGIKQEIDIHKYVIGNEIWNPFSKSNWIYFLMYSLEWITFKWHLRGI
jgi:hypothetical protein